MVISYLSCIHHWSTEASLRVDEGQRQWDGADLTSAYKWGSIRFQWPHSQLLLKSQVPNLVMTSTSKYNWINNLQSRSLPSFSPIKGTLLCFFTQTCLVLIYQTHITKYHYNTELFTTCILWYLCNLHYCDKCQRSWYTCNDSESSRFFLPI